MNQQTSGRNPRNMTRARLACCAVLCGLCVLLAGRYELERRENLRMHAALRERRIRNHAEIEKARRKKRQDAYLLAQVQKHVDAIKADALAAHQREPRNRADALAAPGRAED